MAVGDAVAQFIGTATTNYQPSAGVEEQVSAILKPNGNDSLLLYNGSTSISLVDGGSRISSAQPNSDAPNMDYYNISMTIDNTHYIRKDGTSNRIYFGGVQVG